MDTERQSKMNPSEMGAATTIKMDVFITAVSSKSFVERSLRCFISTRKPRGHPRALAPHTRKWPPPPPTPDARKLPFSGGRIADIFVPIAAFDSECIDNIICQMTLILIACKSPHYALAFIHHLLAVLHDSINSTWICNGMVIQLKAYEIYRFK